MLEELLAPTCIVCTSGGYDVIEPDDDNIPAGAPPRPVFDLEDMPPGFFGK